jgi:hypothetical protein
MRAFLTITAGEGTYPGIVSPVGNHSRRLPATPAYGSACFLQKKITLFPVRESRLFFGHNGPLTGMGLPDELQAIFFFAQFAKPLKSTV